MSFVRIFPDGGVVSSRIGIAIGRLLTLVVSLLPCVSAARAADDRQVVPFNKERQIVRLNIVATDHRGEPVNDLASSDLQISDEGTVEQILYFRRIDRVPGPPAALAPNEISNRTAATIPHATVILLDLMNEQFNTRAYAAHELTRYLQSLESADYLYLYLLTIDGRILPVHGLDAEQQPGGRTAGDSGQRSARESSEPWTKDSKRLIDQAINAAVRAGSANLTAGTRIEWTLKALGAIAAALAHVPGRKNIVWLTDGAPIQIGAAQSDNGQFIDLAPAVRQLSLALERFQVAIYPVQMITIGSSQILPQRPETSSGNRPSAGLHSTETLDQLAAITGGRPTSSKDVRGAVAQAMNDARTNYDVGYAPPDTNWDGKFHKLRVTTRRKGIRIQAKSGYYASPQSRTQRSLEAIRPVGANAMDASEIGIRGSISSVPGARDTSRIDAAIDATDVLTIDDGDRHETSLMAAILTYRPGPQGTTLTAIPPLIPVDTRPPSQSGESAKSPIHFTRDISLAGGAIAVRIIIYDEYGGKLGSLTFRRSGTAFPQ